MTTAYWMGRPLEEMTKEELIEAFRTLGELMAKQQEELAKQNEFTADCMRALADRMR